MKAPRTIISCALMGALACAVGCGGTQKPASGSNALTVARLYPLRAGSVWTYDVDTGQGPPILAITRVTASSDASAEVVTGSDPILYQRRVEGLYRDDRGAFVLREPIRQGEQWEAGGGATAEIRDVAKQVSTPAGDFHDCVEVVESGGDAGKVVRTVFCPDVGPVEVESSMQMSLTGGQARVLARLRGYDFSGALAQ